MMKILVYKDGVAIDAIIAPPQAAVSVDHTSVSWSDEIMTRDGCWFYASETGSIGWALGPDGLPTTPTPPAPTLDELRAAKIAEIIAETDADLARGAPAEGGRHVALDDGSRADLTALASTATAVLISNGAVTWPDSYARGWITLENTRVPLATPSEGLAFAAAVGGYYSAIVQHRRDLKDAALAATSAAELDAIMV